MNEIICGDALTVLRTLPRDSVNCCCTSPPYFGLRDYNCDGQIGLEETPEQYISKLTEIFREVRRVLSPDGVCWINIGDSYAGSGKNAWTADKLKQLKNKQSYKYTTDNLTAQMPKTWAESGIKPKDMLCIPFLLALALRGDGWYLRSDVIWEKTNDMTYYFDIEKCRDCPKKDGCYKDGAKSNTYSVTILSETHQRQKDFQQSDYFKERAKERYKIVAKNAELKCVHGLDEADSVGVIAMRLQSYFTAFVANVKRIVKLKGVKMA